MFPTRPPISKGRRDPGSLRRWNEYVVVNALRHKSPQRTSELAQSTGLTAATLGTVLKNLETKQWIDLVAPESGSLGRPAQLYAFKEPQGSILGIDVGKHTVRAVRTTLSGDLISQGEIEGPHTTAQLPEVIEAAAEQAYPPKTQTELWLCGLAFSGLIDEEGTVQTSVAFPEWEGLNLAEKLAHIVPCQITAFNDMYAAMEAEHLRGAAIGVNNFLQVHLGRRPTFGIVIDGHEYKGAHHTAGDMARNNILPTEERQHWLDPFRDHADPLAYAVTSAITGDERAINAVREHITQLTPSLVMAAALIDPELVVLSGALAPLAPHYLEDVTNAITNGTTIAPQVAASPLNQYAVAQGAALRALHELFDSLAGPNGVLPLTRESASTVQISTREPKGHHEPGTRIQ